MNGGPTLCRFWRAAVAASIFSRESKEQRNAKFDATVSM